MQSGNAMMPLMKQQAFANKQGQSNFLKKKTYTNPNTFDDMLKSNVRQMNRKENVPTGGQNVLQDSLNYASQIRSSRTSRRDAALAVKKLHYDYKSISSQIMRSKTSTSAKEVAGKARREVLRLKRQKQSGNCDMEEVQTAITHAQAMERVAKKKASDLQEEEMVKITDEPGAVAAEERPAEEGYDISDEEMMNMIADELGMEPDELDEMVSEMTDEQAAEFAEFVDEMKDAMEELLEEGGLEELLEQFGGNYEQEMSRADFEELRTKHRNDEMKAIVKADSEYLKDTFKRMERQKTAAEPKIVIGENAGSAAYMYSSNGIADAIGRLGLPMASGGINVVV